MMAWYGIAPTSNLWMLPVFVVMLIAHAAGVGVWLAALNLKYRDVRHIVPFLIQLWFFVSPVAYPTSFIPEQWRWLYGINPMAGVIRGVGGPF